MIVRCLVLSTKMQISATSKKPYCESRLREKQPKVSALFGRRERDIHARLSAHMQTELCPGPELEESLSHVIADTSSLNASFGREEISLVYGELGISREQHVAKQSEAKELALGVTEHVLNLVSNVEK